MRVASVASVNVMQSFVASRRLTERRRVSLIVALALLATVQLAHILDELRYSRDAEFPGVLMEQNGQLGIVLALVACLAVAMRWNKAPQIAALAGGLVAAGFVLYHGIPFKIGVTNPYWGPAGHADAIRWLTVLTAIALGIWSVWLAASKPAHRR